MLSNAEREALANAYMLRCHKVPKPNDSVFLDVRRVGGVLVPFGIQAQGALGVFDAWRGDVELVSYARSPWSLLQKPIRNFAQSALNSRFTAAAAQSITATDVSGVSDTFDAARSANAGQAATFNLGTDGAQLVMRWGTSGTAATATDKFLLAEADNVAASGLTIDLTAFTDTFSGSKVYAGANTTAREIGFSQRFRNQANTTDRAILFDRTVISDTTVNNGQTVAVSYTVQF